MRASGTPAKSSRMGVNRPTYVAGLERGVRPMGDWSISITLSTAATPSSASCSPGSSRAALSARASERNRISVTSVLLPLPETPVTAVIVPSGNATSTFFRLWARAFLHGQRLAVARPPLLWNWHHQLAAQVSAGNGTWLCQQLGQ